MRFEGKDPLAGSRGAWATTSNCIKSSMAIITPERDDERQRAGPVDRVVGTGLQTEGQPRSRRDMLEPEARRAPAPHDSSRRPTVPQPFGGTQAAVAWLPSRAPMKQQIDGALHTPSDRLEEHEGGRRGRGDGRGSHPG